MKIYDVYTRKRGYYSELGDLEFSVEETNHKLALKKARLMINTNSVPHSYFHDKPVLVRVIKRKNNNKQKEPKKNPPSDGQWAGTILQQLGGNKFIAMTGASQFVKDDAKRQITFKIMRNAKGVNYVRIKLTSMDLYDMEFINIRAGKITVKSKADGIYNDQLQEIFTNHTGLYTRLY